MPIGIELIDARLGEIGFGKKHGVGGVELDVALRMFVKGEDEVSAKEEPCGRGDFDFIGDETLLLPVGDGACQIAKYTVLMWEVCLADIFLIEFGQDEEYNFGKVVAAIEDTHIIIEALIYGVDWGVGRLLKDSGDVVCDFLRGVVNRLSKQRAFAAIVAIDEGFGDASFLGDAFGRGTVIGRAGEDADGTFEDLQAALFGGQAFGGHVFHSLNVVFYYRGGKTTQWQAKAYLGTIETSPWP